MLWASALLLTTWSTSVPHGWQEQDQLVKKAAPAGLDSDRYAVVIGVNDPHATAAVTGAKIPPLGWASTDAMRVGESLGEMGWQVTVLNRPAETRASEVHKVLEELDCTPDDTVLVYYAGHGFELKSTMYMTGSGTSFEETKAEGKARAWAVKEESLLTFGSLNSALDRAGAMRRIYIVDACRDDARQAGVEMDGAGTLDLAKRTGLPDRPVVVNRRATERDELAREQVSIVALMSCSRNESSYEVGGGGIFSASFLEALTAARKKSIGEPVGVESLGAAVQQRLTPRADYLGKTMTVRLMGDFAGQMPLYESPVGPELMQLTGEAKQSITMRELLGAFTRAFRYQLGSIPAAPVDLKKKMPGGTQTYVEFLKGEPDEALRLQVMTLLSRGIDPGLFDVTSGASEATRYHVAWLIWQLNTRLGRTLPKAGIIPVDVPAGHWGYDAVKELPLLAEGDIDYVMESLAQRLRRLGLQDDLVEKVRSSVQTNFSVVYSDGPFRGARPVFSTEAMGFILGFYEAASRIEEQKALNYATWISACRARIEEYRVAIYKDATEKLTAREKIVEDCSEVLSEVADEVTRIQFLIGTRNDLQAEIRKFRQELKEISAEIGTRELFGLKRSDLEGVRTGGFIAGNTAFGGAVTLSDFVRKISFAQRGVDLHVRDATRFSVSYLEESGPTRSVLRIAPWPEGLRLETNGALGQTVTLSRNGAPMAWPTEGQISLSALVSIDEGTLLMRPVLGWIDRGRDCRRAVIGFEGVGTNYYFLIESE